MEHLERQDGNHQSKKKLDDLPPSNSHFWDDAEVNTGIIPKVKFMDEPHVFIRITGHQAQCTHCDWGFELDPGDKITDGHLFDREGNKII
jgi:hypothetical protein